MAGASLLTLLDDIATLLDDVAVLTKAAAKKTAGVLGDDLALNAQQVAGVRAHRELPVVWAVFKGSLVNKAILVPAALLISIFVPVLVVPLMMVGGAYLCYEGTEKVVHRMFRRGHAPDPEERARAVLASGQTPQALEKEKVRGAVRTDFILSAEIIVLSLPVVAAAATMLNQVSALVVIALAVTVGVYGLVAGIVKLDDAGLWLCGRGGSMVSALGRGLVYIAPWLMKALGIIGTVAMFLVGGGIFVHNIDALHHLVEVAQSMGLPAFVADTLASLVVGLVVGALVLAAVSLVGKLRGGRAETAH
jgi:predicted DNA repair protein MutK